MVKKQEADGKQKRAARHSRSVLLHGYGGAALRVFATYQVDDGGQPEKIVVRAYHRESAAAGWNPSDASMHSTVEEMEDEITDWKLRAVAAGYKQLSNRGRAGQFTKESIPPLPKQPKPGVFTKGGLPGPLSVKHGGSGPAEPDAAAGKRRR